MPDTKETFPRGPSNEQTLLTELGAARRQLAEIKAIDAQMCLDYSTMVEQLAEMKAERDAANAEIDELGRVLKIVAAERDALAVTAERQAKQIRQLRESLAECAEIVADNYGQTDEPVRKARAILKETAP